MELNKTDDKCKNIEVFTQVANENLRVFTNAFNSYVFDYCIKNSYQLSELLNEDQVRQVAVNFFSKSLAKKSFELQDFYFDKLIITL